MDEHTAGTILNAKLQSINTLPESFVQHSTIVLLKNQCTIGRSLDNNVVIANVAISRLHCTLDHVSAGWKITDHSRYGILINGNKINNKEECILQEKDIIQLDLAGDFVYKFTMGCARKRKYSETCNEVDDRIDKAKNAFNNTQNIEINNMKKKINLLKLNQSNVLIEKNNLKNNLKQQFENLEKDYQIKIQELKGKHDEVEKQKELLKQQNEEEKQTLEREMNEKILILEEKIKEQIAYENALEAENRTLLERLAKEKVEMEKTLKNVLNVKEQKLDDLEKQLKKKEEELIEEKQRMEKLRLEEIKQQQNAKEMELKNLRAKMEAEKEMKLKEIESLKLQMEMQENMSNETRKQNEDRYQLQIEQLKKEAEEIRNSVMQKEEESVSCSKISDEEKKALEERLSLMEREKFLLQELLLQKSKQSEEEILKIQKEQNDKEKAVREQYEKEKQQLVNLLSKETESCNSTIKQMQQELSNANCKAQHTSNNKVTIKSEIIDLTNSDIPSTSYCPPKTESHVDELNRIMDAELQCSICSDLFIQPVTLNCTHTFCKYCIDKWRKKKNTCPTCRAKIKTQLFTNILESLISSMVESLGDEAKEKRKEIVKERQEITAKEQSAPRTHVQLQHINMSPHPDNIIEMLVPEFHDYRGYVLTRLNRRRRGRNNWR